MKSPAPNHTEKGSQTQSSLWKSGHTHNTTSHTNSPPTSPYLHAHIETFSISHCSRKCWLVKVIRLNLRFMPIHDLMASASIPYSLSPTFLCKLGGCPFCAIFSHSGRWSIRISVSLESGHKSEIGERSEGKRWCKQEAELAARRNGFPIKGIKSALDDLHGNLLKGRWYVFTKKNSGGVE